MCDRTHISSYCVGAVGWGTAKQAGKSLVSFPLVSLEVFVDVILPAALCLWGLLILWVPGIFPGNLKLLEHLGYVQASTGFTFYVCLLIYIRKRVYNIIVNKKPYIFVYLLLIFEVLLLLPEHSYVS